MKNSKYLTNNKLIILVSFFIFAILIMALYKFFLPQNNYNSNPKNDDITFETSSNDQSKSYKSESSESESFKLDQSQDAKPLVEDDKFDIVVLKECDLAIKIKKVSTLKYKEYAGTYLLDINEGEENIDCSVYATEFYAIYPATKKHLTQETNIEYVDIRTKRADYDFKKVDDIPLLNKASKKVLPEDTEVGVYRNTNSYTFIGNKGFIININTKTEDSSVSEIQFDSLSPSTPSYEVSLPAF